LRSSRRLQVIQHSIVREMACLGREFEIDGSVVRGPGTTAVAIRDHADATGGHVDLGYVLRLGDGAGPVVWDCAAGLGRTEEERLNNAVRMWRTTTASAMVELLERRGLHGDHFPPNAPGGVQGWHTVQGPACVFGFHSEPLGDWLAAHHLLTAVAGQVLPRLRDPALNGVRFFFGGRSGDEVAEVRINGEPAPAASAARGGLDWPRGERLAWARCFVLLAADPEALDDVEGRSRVEGRPQQPRTRIGAGAGARLLRRWLQA
jgi:hypothetical protein